MPGLVSLLTFLVGGAAGLGLLVRIGKVNIGIWASGGRSEDNSKQCVCLCFAADIFEFLVVVSSSLTLINCDTELKKGCLSPVSISFPLAPSTFRPTHP